jgi:hypothetical protein
MHLQISLGNFYGIDSIIDITVMIMAILISYQSHKIYSLVKEKNFKYFSWAFGTIGAAYLFKTISNITAVQQIIIQRSDFIIVFMHELQRMQLINFMSFTLYKTLLLAGFLILFLIMTKTSTKENVILFFYLSAIAILFSIYFDIIFHLTLIILLIFLTVYFYNNYKKVKSTNSHLVFLAFAFILLSIIIESFYPGCASCDILDEIVLLAGFSILLVNHLKIKNEQKKNKTRSYSRHA